MRLGVSMFSISSNVRDLKRDLTSLQREQLPFAVSLALNAAAPELIEENRDHMQDVFDRPTRWTLNAFHFRRATKARLALTIERKVPARGRHYLEVQTAGGRRPRSGWEKQIEQRAPYAGRVGYVAGAKVKRDSYGNISRGTMQRILSDIHAQGDAGNNATKQSRKRRGGRGLGGYFIAPAGSKLKPGVYQRRGGRKISRVLTFDTKAPTYRPRFKFEDVMRRKAEIIMPMKLKAAMDRALATARVKP